MRVQLSLIQGTSFEVSVIQLLGKKFPEARFLHNLQVYSYDLQKMTQVDVVMIHPCGIIAIETKDWREFVRGGYSLDKWIGKGRSRNTLEVFSPVYQNWIHCRALWSSALRSAILLPYIHNVVCVPDSTRIESECEEVCLYSYLTHKVDSITRLASTTIDPDQLIQRLEEAKCWE